jgi:hypothetical protein
MFIFSTTVSRKSVSKCFSGKQTMREEENCSHLAARLLAEHDFFFFGGEGNIIKHRDLHTNHHELNINETTILSNEMQSTKMTLKESMK